MKRRNDSRMKNRRCISACLGVLLWIVQSTSAAGTAYSWSTNTDSIALVSSNQVVWRFNFSVTNATKPFFHPLSLPGGEPLTWQSPEDHPWHYGLWFSWKYLNGVNYWEENTQTRRSEGTTSWRSVKQEAREDHSAHLELQLDYRPRNATNSILTELRQLDVSAPRADGSYVIDWWSEFEAGAEAVRFDRTPLPGEPGGQVYGGYAGLSLRFAREFSKPQLHATGDVGERKDNRYRFAAAAADYGGQIDGSECGVAILEHPSNPRHPGRWYAIDSPDQSTRFINAAWLQLKPFDLAAKARFTLRYRIIVHPGLWDHSQLQTEASQYSASGK